MFFFFLISIITLVGDKILKEIKIKFVDFWKGFDEKNNTIVDILKTKYNVVFDENPDYIFYTFPGNEHIKYKCIRIFFTGECIVPDFTNCDYAIGFDHINFGDRYIRVPLYTIFQYLKDYQTAQTIRSSKDRNLLSQKEFCSFVVSNGFGQKERKEFFELLSKYKKVDSGGKYLNNIGYRVEDKNQFQSKHKFCIAFENTVYPGYTTEKLIQAFAVDTLPIYYGNPKIDEEFNDKAFINCHKFDNFEDVVKEVIRLDNDDKAYLEMMSQPIGGKTDYIEDLTAFLFNIFDQDYDKAFRRPINSITERLELEWIQVQKVKRLLSPLLRIKNHFRRKK